MQPIGFEEHIKTMFRPRDRQSMEFAFDLWSYDDVAAHADDILARVRAGTMPCDGAWPKEQVDAFQSWIDAGKPFSEVTVCEVIVIERVEPCPAVNRNEKSPLPQR